MSDSDKLGFRPKMIFPAVGTTFEGRQAGLAELAKLFSQGVVLNNYNGGLGLHPESNNPHDIWAVAIWAKCPEYSPVGYVPKKWCPDCGKALTAAQFNLTGCPFCGMSLVELPQANLNKWITENFVKVGKPLACGMAWAGTGAVGKTYGLRVGISWEDPK